MYQKSQFKRLWRALRIFSERQTYEEFCILCDSVKLPYYSQMVHNFDIRYKTFDRIQLRLQYFKMMGATMYRKALKDSQCRVP